MSIEWKDATTYSRGERGSTDPTAWECIVNGIRVWVSSGHMYHPEEWVMNCQALHIREFILGKTASTTAADAQKAALSRVALVAARQAKQLSALVSEISQ